MKEFPGQTRAFHRRPWPKAIRQRGGVAVPSKEIARAVAYQVGISQKRAKKILGDVVKAWRERLVKNKEISIPGFGSFRISREKKRRLLAELYGPGDWNFARFKPAKVLIDRLQEPLKDEVPKVNIPHYQRQYRYCALCTRPIYANLRHRTMYCKSCAFTVALRLQSIRRDLEKTRVSKKAKKFRWRLLQEAAQRRA